MIDKQYIEDLLKVMSANPRAWVERRSNEMHELCELALKGL